MNKAAAVDKMYARMAAEEYVGRAILDAVQDRESTGDEYNVNVDSVARWISLAARDAGIVRGDQNVQELTGLIENAMAMAKRSFGELEFRHPEQADRYAENCLSFAKDKKSKLQIL